MRPITAQSYPFRGAGTHLLSRTLEPSTLEGIDDHGLLSLLLDRSVAGSAGDRVSADLIDYFGGLGEIVAADLPELSRVAGLGPTAILDLKLLRQLSIRLARSTASARPALSSWNALVAYARVTLAHSPREQFRTLYLDRRNILMRDELVADGSVDHAPVYPREVIRRALELSASALILVHNHPTRPVSITLDHAQEA